MLVEYVYFSGADNGWNEVLSCVGFPRNPHAPILKQHGAFVCDEDDFRAFFRRMASDVIERPFHKPRVQVVFVKRGEEIFFWHRLHYKWYEHGRISKLRERWPAGVWIKLNAV